MSGHWSTAMVLLTVGVLAGSCGTGDDATPEPAEGVDTGGREVAASYVGSAACAGCHPVETERWRGSHHDLAIQEATAETVLGDFGGATFEHAGVTSTFSRRDGRFFVRTDGPDGELADFEIAYTFGVTPLQQYLIPFPGGRYQALGIAWDSRSRDAGGQRWFHLYPDRRLVPGDPLHWTGIDQTWNHMCAECHSTNLRKGYRADERRYETTWSELDVACESCHGAGSAHVAWARAAAETGGSEGGSERDATASDRSRGGGAAEASAESAMGLLVRLRDRDLDAWVIDPLTGIARRTGPPPSRAEVETCARCHSRRGLLDERWVPGRSILETHRPALLDAGLYHADGQILDEVYEYGSFLQSRMYAAGVTCSDCHDPHSLELLASGDALCARCHAPERFAVEAHHRHPVDADGARCVSCHMPERFYMIVDGRRDHSLRVPRPDLHGATGAPDACTGCHRDRDPAWAAETIEAWHGRRERPRHWGEAVAAAWRGDTSADGALLEVVRDALRPAIARGTALSLLADPAAPAARAALERALDDPDGLVRLGALAALERGDVEQRVAMLPRLLEDPALAIRTEAARLLAEAPAERLGAADRAAHQGALAEYRATQESAADRPEAHLNLGNLALSSGDPAQAEEEYREALRIDPTFAPAHLNLADVQRLAGRDQEAVRTLRAAIARLPEEAVLHHSLGLALVRVGDSAGALSELERAAALAPAEGRYAYVLGVALHSAGRADDAVGVLERALAEHSGNSDLLSILATIERERGNREAALRHARRLASLHPGDPTVTALVEELSSDREHD